MESIFEALYHYALKYRFDGYFLPDEDERRENETMVRLAREELSAKGLGNAAERLEDGLYFINVTVDLLGEDRETVVGLESWSFPYAFVEDRWVFTDFRLVY